VCGCGAGNSLSCHRDHYDYYDDNLAAAEFEEAVFLSAHTGTVAEAKAKFSELLEKEMGGTAVVVAAEQW
jgi:hypothetical protein